MPRTSHPELHRTERIGWLRAAVLGANDGIVSTASLMVGVAAAGTGRAELLVTGMAGLVAGAMSMAAGEYVSVRSQADTEHADVRRERAELAAQPDLEDRHVGVRAREEPQRRDLRRERGAGHACAPERAALIRRSPYRCRAACQHRRRQGGGG